MAYSTNMLKLAATLGYQHAIKEAGMGSLLKYLIPAAGGFAVGAALMSAIDGNQIATTAEKIRQGLSTTPPGALSDMLTQGMPPEMARHLAYYQTPEM